MLREEFAFLFQTFSRSDPPGKAPKKRKKIEKKKENKKLKMFYVFVILSNGIQSGKLVNQRRDGGSYGIGKGPGGKLNSRR